MKKVTPKQEAAARAYAAGGITYTDAYRVGYNCENMADGTVQRKAHLLFTLPHVAARVRKLQREATRRADVTEDEIIAATAALAFTELREILDHSGGRLTLADFRNLTRAQSLCIESVDQRPDGTLKVKLYSRVAALDMLAKFRGMYTQRLDVHHSGSLHNLTDEQLAAIASGAADSSNG